MGEPLPEPGSQPLPFGPWRLWTWERWKKGSRCLKKQPQQGTTVDGCEIHFAPLEKHRKPLLVGIDRESSFQGFLGGAGLVPSTNRQPYLDP